MIEQPREQAAQDHGVRDIGDVELVKAKKPHLVGDVRGGEPDWIVISDRTAFELLPESMDALVHVGHELVEVHPALADHRTSLEEQVHQHGLPAANLPEAIE